MKKFTLLISILIFTFTNSFNFHETIETSNLLEHAKQLDRIAIQNGNTRDSISGGFNQSLIYVKEKLEKFLGKYYQLSTQPFSYKDHIEIEPSKLQWLQYPSRQYLLGRDFLGHKYQGDGDLTGTLNYVQGGCRDSDFEKFKEGNIALVQRGVCDVNIVLSNARKFRASGLIFWMEGNLYRLNLRNQYHIPVFLVNSLVAAEWVGQAKVDLKMYSKGQEKEISTANLIIESIKGNPQNTVILGAHLDGVAEGRGINDNGSGTSALLEIAIQYANYNIELLNKLRIIWFGAEELGLLGSLHYVNHLSNEELLKIRLMLNFDMVGSPNFVRYIYNGSSTEQNIREGSVLIQKTFQRYFDSQNLANDLFIADGSDHRPFMLKGIPIGRIQSGHTGIKTDDQQRRYGGRAGIAHDPCYHQPCDTFHNINPFVITQMTRAAAFTSYYFLTHRIPFKRVLDEKLLKEKYSKKIELSDEFFFKHF